jgi:hypothetical protein
MEKQSIINTIQSNESEIKKLEALRNTLDPAKWQFRQTSNRIDALQKANVGHYAILKTFKEEKIDVKKDVFGSIGDRFNVKGETLELYVFIVIAILIELGLLITSKDIKTNTKSTSLKPTASFQSTSNSDNLLGEVLIDDILDSKKELLQFTEALFSDNKKLNGDPVVSQKTGIPPERCAKYRKYLSELHIGDKPAISKKQGGSVSNFPKEVIQNFIGGIIHDPSFS